MDDRRGVSASTDNPKNIAVYEQALRALNVKIRDDPRVDRCLVSIGDGVMLARKL